jgi:hypothetical protein
MNRDRLRRARHEIAGLADAGLDWVSLAQATSEALAGIVPFDRSCWHTVDPGTVLFTGSLNQNIGCSGTWLATYEYLVEDVNKWWFLARSGPGVIVFDGDGNPESLSPGAEHWIAQMVEVPPPSTPAESKVVQAVAARARTTDPGQDPLLIGARSRVRTR